MLFSVFKALGPISIPTPPTASMTEFFHANIVASVHPLPVSWYLISPVCVYMCSCRHIMSILCSTADAISSGSWPILFKVLTLNVAISIFFCILEVFVIWALQLIFQTLGPAITILYRNTKVKVRSPEEDKVYIDIVAGILQGDTPAKYLFIICVDYALRTLIDKIRENGFELTKKRSRRYYLPTPPLGQDKTQGQFLSGV